MGWQIESLPSAARELASLPEDVRRRVGRPISALAEEPRPPGSKKLQGGGAGLYRIRAGPYRVVYRIRDDMLKVTILRIRHRRDVYRGL